MLVGFPFAMIGTFSAGYFFDIMGRRMTLFTTFIAGSVFVFAIPYTSPNVFPGLCIVRTMITVLFSAPASNPLLADYVHKDAIGKAAAFVGLGYVIGEVLAMAILFNVTKNFSPYMAFLTTAVVGAFCSSFFLCLVKEPQLRKSGKDSADTSNDKELN